MGLRPWSKASIEAFPLVGQAFQNEVNHASCEREHACVLRVDVVAGGLVRLAFAIHWLARPRSTVPSAMRRECTS